MYICRNCGEEFGEPELRRTTYEDYYGCSDLWGSSRTPMTIEVCPYCGIDEIEDISEEE